jgi:3-oxoacyl-[acyl-carrier-protein] synthase III
MNLAADTVLEIIAQGAWNGGNLVDNSIYENKGMTFKGGIPVNNKTIEERIGVRTRVVAPEDERIGVLAFQDLLQTSDIDPSRIKLVIGATNIGEDKLDSGPLIRHPFQLVSSDCPDALVLDLYAGCPGFNASVELVFILSLAGIVKPDDLSIIVGAENVHRAKSFPPNDTANIIFGDDALATALVTRGSASRSDSVCQATTMEFKAGEDPTHSIAKKLAELTAPNKIDGIIVDNQLGKLASRIPATAARVQHRLVEQLYPNEAARGTFKSFRNALKFYDQHVNCFAFDIMTLNPQPDPVAKIAAAYANSGKYRRMVSIYLASDHQVVLTLHEGKNRSYPKPKWGIIDCLTQTHGCFADYIEARPTNSDIFGSMNGKGVFLLATRGAKRHLDELLSGNNLTLNDIDLLIEHQANFAMIPLTLEQVLGSDKKDVCMQRLPYDLERSQLRADKIQGYPINQNLEKLRHAKTILYDSIGAGMTRSSFIQRKK